MGQCLIRSDLYGKKALLVIEVSVIRKTKKSSDSSPSTSISGGRSTSRFGSAYMAYLGSGCGAGRRSNGRLLRCNRVDFSMLMLISSVGTSSALIESSK
jgi:hypothetical protein